MRLAIVHDWLVINAGAEKVLKEIIGIYPDADIFSLVDFLTSKQRDEVLNGKFSITSFIQKLPFAKTHFRNYLPLFSKAIESFNFDGYDLIISSSWAVAKGVKKIDKQLHICYCHTPIRYAWDLYDEYISNLSQPKKFIVQKTLQRLRQWDIDTLDRVDYFIANSQFVANRIRKTYDRDAKIIYPPVDDTQFDIYEAKESFYVTASRLVPYKKTRLIVEAFNEMPDIKLVVIGYGEEYDYIKQIAKDNIAVLGYQDNEVLVQNMQKAKAFVYAAIEDFGIVPIEAMACGTPVIALNDGGTAETVIDGINGIHFNTQSKESIIDAVKRFESKSFSPLEVRKTTKKYTNFKKEFKAFVDDKINKIK